MALNHRRSFFASLLAFLKAKNVQFSGYPNLLKVLWIVLHTVLLQLLFLMTHYYYDMRRLFLDTPLGLIVQYYCTTLERENSLLRVKDFMA